MRVFLIIFGIFFVSILLMMVGLFFKRKPITRGACGEDCKCVSEQKATRCCEDHH